MKYNPPLDLTGMQFARLTVTDEIGRDKRGSVLWRCLCSCGNTTAGITNEIRSGHKKSCGCARSDANRKRNFKHGEAIRGRQTKRYVKFKNLRSRGLLPACSFFEFQKQILEQEN
jgi:hypothetical protein